MDEINELILELKISKNEIEEKIRKSSSTPSVEENISKQIEFNNLKTEIIELINTIKVKQQELNLEVEDINMVELQEVEGSQNIKNLIDELSREIENGKTIPVLIDNKIAELQNIYQECINKKKITEMIMPTYTKRKMKCKFRKR